MAGGVTIRPAREGDAAVLFELIRDLAEYEKLSHEVVATEGDIHALLFGDGAVAEALLADYDGRPVGFALYYRTVSTFLGKTGIYLEDLFVKPNIRRKGVGRALLAGVARRTVEMGGGRLEWQALDWNEPAHIFYRGLGAKSMDEWKNFRLTGKALSDLARQANS